MNSVRIGWQQASRWQRIAIVWAAVVVVGVVAPREPGNAPTATFAALKSNATTGPAASRRITPAPTVAPTAHITPAPRAAITPVPNSTVAPTVKPTPIPEPTALPVLPVTKVGLTASVCNGCTASVTIKTSAGARCTIDVVYNSGSSTAAGLDPKTASSTGKVKWSWEVGVRTATGEYPIYIDCSKGDRYGDLTLYFKVT